MDGSKILSMVVGNICFLDFLDFLPMSLNSMPKSYDLTCKKGCYPYFLIRPRIWIMWALILKPSSMGQAKCQVKNEPNFWNGTRSKKTKLFALSRNSWPTAWMMLMYWDRHVVHLGICF